MPDINRIGSLQAFRLIAVLGIRGILCLALTLLFTLRFPGVVLG